MRSKKGFLSAGALFMGLIVLLGVLGIVSGLWSKNLVIHGVVETGDVNADWDCGYTNDDGAEVVIQGAGCDPVPVEATGDDGLDPDNYDWPNFNNTTHPLKDVGNCVLSFDPAADFGYQEAFVKITNAYPSYECTISLFLTNTGSIPFNVISANLVLPDASQGVLETVDAAGNDLCDPSALLDDPQVDPGNEKQLDCTVHVSQIAEQSTCTADTLSQDPTRVGNVNCDPIVSYEFAIDVCVAQWNEAATAQQCKESDQHEGPLSSDTIRVESPVLHYGPTGWGGWSCPADYHVVGGGYEPAGATVLISEAAEPGSDSGLYPTYPHYTFSAGETGWVVQNDNDSEDIVVFALCAPN